jgi:hypothetical protein
MKRVVRRLAIPALVGVAMILALVPVGGIRRGSGGLIVSLVGPDAALARRIISPPSTDFSAPSPPVLDARGHRVTINGRILCSPIGHTRFRVQVTVTQLGTDDSDGAIASGVTDDFCTGDIQSLTVDAHTLASTVLEPGPARLCAVAVTYGGGGPVNDAFQWCKDVPLVSE